MERLRNEIAEKTKTYKIPENKQVSRVFYIPINDELKSIELWYKQWYPIHTSVLESIYCWFPICEPEGYKDTIELAWRKAMDANTIKSLTTAGYRLLDNSLQVIFLIDLSKSDSYEKIEKITKLFEQHIKNWGSDLQVVFSCITIIRNYIGDLNQIAHPIKFEEFFRLSKNKFNRLYCVDIANSRGTFISESSDMNFFLVQLLYYLTKKPIETTNFKEWIDRNPAEKELASAFSAISLIFPIDYVLEVCLIKKGSEKLEQTIFSKPLTNREDFYINSIINNNNFNSYITLKNSIVDSINTKLFNPINDLKTSIKQFARKPFQHRIKLRLELYKLVNSKLAEMASRNKELIDREINNIFGNFKYNLIDTADSIIVNEVGSKAIFNSLINGVNDRINNLIPEHKSSVEIYDINKLFNHLEKEVDKVPTNEAVIVRTFILLILLAILLFSLLHSYSIIRFSSGGFIVLLLGIFVYKWFAIRSRINRLIVRIEETINKQWELLFDDVIKDTVGKIRNSCLNNCDDVKQQIQKVFKRFSDIIKFGKERYEPSSPIESAFWINVINNREDALQYYDRISDKKSLKPFKDIVSESSLEIWNRLSFTNEEDLNEYELGLLEKVSLEFIPNCNNLLSTSICEVLEKDSEKLENMKFFLSRYSDPFTTINTSNLPTFLEGVFEAPEVKCSVISESLKETISQHFKLESKDSGSSYRISFFSFAEGIEFKEVLNKLKE